jgi:hypothetical protein
MSIEAHITLAHPPEVEPALDAWLAERRLKLTRIELAQGASPRQTMITARRDGPLDDVLRDARAIRGALAPLGVDVTRVKIEIARAACASPAPALYLEHHVKVRTPEGHVPALAAIGAAHRAHLSRNPASRRGGVEERFLTQRFAPHASRAALEGLRALLRALRAAPARVVKIERERVLYDDNLALDAGWSQEFSS